MDRRRRQLFVLLLLLGVVLRAIFVVEHPRFAGDTLLYGDLAHNMLQHHIYGFTEATRIRPTLIRLPGYPSFLAVCFVLFGLENYTAVLWIQVAADLLTCWLLSRLARRVLGERVGLVAFGLAALCPFTANYCAVGLAETLSLTCVALALLSLNSWLSAARAGRPWNRWLLGLAGSLSYAVLLRPDEALLAAAVVPVMLVVSWRMLGAGSLLRRVGPVVAVCAALLLPLLLWGVRNQRVLGTFQPLAPKYANDPTDRVSYGFYRWYRTWAVEYISNLDVYWAYDGDPLQLSDLPPRTFDSAAERVKTARLLARYNQESASTPPVEAAFDWLAAEREHTHPLRTFVFLPLARETDMWFRPRTEFMPLPLDWWHWRTHPGGSTLAILYGVLNALLLLAAARGLWIWRSAHWAGHGALALAALGFVALRCVLLLTLDNSEPRYTIECYPVVLFVASFAFRGASKLPAPSRT